MQFTKFKIKCTLCNYPYWIHKKSLPETGTGRLSFLLRAPGTPENLAASSWPPGAPGARANPPGREEMTGWLSGFTVGTFVSEDTVKIKTP